MQCKCLSIIGNSCRLSRRYLAHSPTAPPTSVPIHLSAKEGHDRRAVAGIRYDTLIQTNAVYTDKLYNSIHYI